MDRRASRGEERPTGISASSSSTADVRAGHEAPTRATSTSTGTGRPQAERPVERGRRPVPISSPATSSRGATCATSRSSCSTPGTRRGCGSPRSTKRQASSVHRPHHLPAAGLGPRAAILRRERPRAARRARRVVSRPATGHALLLALGGRGHQPGRGRRPGADRAAALRRRRRRGQVRRARSRRRALACSTPTGRLPRPATAIPQAAVTIPAAVTANGARHCAVRECEIAHVGSYGLWLGRGCKDCRIVQNHIHDLGAGGVRIGEAKMADDRRGRVEPKPRPQQLHPRRRARLRRGRRLLAGPEQPQRRSRTTRSTASTTRACRSAGTGTTPPPARSTTRSSRTTSITWSAACSATPAASTPWARRPAPSIRNNVFHDIWPYMGRPAMAWGIYFDAGTQRADRREQRRLPHADRRDHEHGHPRQRGPQQHLRPERLAGRLALHLAEGALVGRRAEHLLPDAGRAVPRRRRPHRLPVEVGPQPLLANRRPRAGVLRTRRSRSGRPRAWTATPGWPIPSSSTRPASTSASSPTRPPWSWGSSRSTRATVGLAGPPEWVDLPQAG